MPFSLVADGVTEEENAEEFSGQYREPEYAKQYREPEPENEYREQELGFEDGWPVLQTVGYLTQFYKHNLLACFKNCILLYC